MLLARIAALLLFAAFAVAADGPTVDPNIRQLTADNFKDTVAHGAWLIEHFSPKCAHCRAFAPTWSRLSKDMKYLERLAGFHMAQVNCLAQGDLCMDNDIRGYPQIDLYIDGKLIEEYKNDRNYDFVRQWIETEATKYARSIVLGTEDDDVTTEDAALVRRPNPKGAVTEIDPTELNRLKQEGPVFVDFYAPWCSHCKHLRPILEKVAAQLKGQINIVAVNCDAYGNVCKDNGVKGFPTLKLFEPIDGGANWNITEYNKARKQDLIASFLKPAFKIPKMQPMKVDDLDQIVRDEDVFLIYMQNYATTLDDLTLVERNIKPLLGQVPIYTSNDPMLYQNLSIADPVPSSLLLAFAGHALKPVSTLSLPTQDPEEVTKWLNKNRYPLLTTLNKDTYAETMESEDQPLIVLGAVHSDARNADQVKIMEDASRAFRRGGRSQYRPVRFVVADDSLYSALHRMYGIRPADLPRLVVIDPSKQVYYEGTTDGKRATFDGESAFSVLEGVWQGWSRPVPVRSTAWGHSTMMGMGSSHPFMTTLLTVAFLATVGYCGLKCMRRDIRSNRGGYMNEKGFGGMGSKSGRLD